MGRGRRRVGGVRKGTMMNMDAIRLRAWARLPALVVLFLGAVLSQGAAAQLWPGDATGLGKHTGKAVVEGVCSKCHATGLNGAPKIGDEAAWSRRAKQGLTSLTRHALEGIRNMPAHGGTPDLTDMEVSRAIIYMVNQSGGHWIEPVAANALPAERTGEQVVRGQCYKCHEAGLNGAPKIGDRDAWTPRMSHGVDYLVRSAVHGHGGMPARGGEADLTDSELRGAILYMFNPKFAGQGAAVRTPSALAGAGAADSGPNHAVAGNVEVFLGIVPAQFLLSYPVDSVERTMHGGVPAGADYFHVNVSLRDLSTQLPINDAQVQIVCERKDPGSGGRETRALEQIAVGPASYGNYVRLKAGAPYVITVQIRVPNAAAPVEAKFDQIVL